MAFFNFYMLLGTLAVLIPIILHILNRKSAKKVKWGAMRFLKDSLVSRRSKILLEEFLLMCLRCLLLLLLALLVARPFITPGARMSWVMILPMMCFATAAIAGSFILSGYPKWKHRLWAVAALLILFSGMALIFEERLQNRIFRANGARDIALVIDASDSMDVLVDGITHYTRAVDEGRRLLETAPAGSTFSLIVGGSIPYAPLASPISDRDQVLTALDEIFPGKGTMKVPETLSLAAMTLARGNNTAKQIILISDGQREGWKLDGKRGEWVAVKESLKQLPGNPPVILRRLDLPDNSRNAGIVGLRFSRESIGTDRPVRFQVTVENTGDQAITPGEVLVEVEGETYSNTEVGQLPPRSEKTVSFEHLFTSTGAHVLTAKLTGQDAVVSDNSVQRVVVPLKELKVLLVDGNPAPRFMDRASAFAALALAPGKDEAGSLMKPKVVTVADFTRMNNLSDYAVILLLDVPRLPKDTADGLAAFVVSGGGLLLAHGPQTVPEFYNNWKLNGSQVLPSKLGEQEFPGLRPGADESEPLSLSTASLNHPALEYLRDNSMNLNQVVFQSYWQLLPPDESTDLPSTIGFRLSNDAPYLMSHALGAGRVVQLATSLDVRDSNLPSTKAFVLVLHQLITHLTDAGSGDLNIPYTLGVHLVLSNLIPSTDPDTRNQLLHLLDEKSGMATIHHHSGEAFSAPLHVMGGGEGRPQNLILDLPPTLSPGLLKVELPEGIRGPLLPWLDEEKKLPVAYFRTGNEGRLQVLTDKDREKIRSMILWQEATSEEQLISAVEGARFGRELWRPIAITLLVLLMTEIGVCRWIALRRHMGESLKVDFQELNQPKASFLKHLDKFKKT